MGKLTTAISVAPRSRVIEPGSRELTAGVGAHSLAECRPVEWIAIPLGALRGDQGLLLGACCRSFGLAPSRGGRAAHTPVGTLRSRYASPDQFVTRPMVVTEHC